MHKREGALVNSPALVLSKLCMFFSPFSPFSSFFYFFCYVLSLFCLYSAFITLSTFYVLFYPFFRLFISALPFVILLYPYPPSFILSSLLALIFCLITLFTIPQSFIYYLLFISFTLVPVSLPFSVCSLCFIYSYSVVVIILLMMCLSLCSLLLEYLDALRHALRVPYHLLIYFP